MNDIKLLRPTMEYEADLLQFCEEIRNAHDADAFAGCGNLRRTTNIQEWLDDLELREHAETCPAGRVPSTTFLAVRICDHKVVGIITLRYPGDDLSVIRTGGHVGYSVRPSERRKGYATEMLRLILKECQHRKMSRILLTCYRDNIASERTILAGGGVFEDEIEDDGEILKRYWITILNTNHTILQITDSAQKSQIAETILSQLPDWFGIPESTQEYINGCADKPLWAAIVDGKPVGFIALKETSPATAEIYVMGVLPQLHHGGIGRALYSAFEEYAREHGYLFIQVKTVRKGSWASYDKTNEFYIAMGFHEFECIPELWDEKNPCQIYVKAVPQFEK